MVILTNQSYLRRFSDCEFDQFVGICLSGPEQCGHHSAAFRVQCCRICPDFLHGFMIVLSSVLEVDCSLTGLGPSPLPSPGGRGNPGQRVGLVKSLLQ